MKRIDEIKAKPSVIGNKITLDKNDFDLLITVAKQHVVQEKKESALKKALEKANRLIVKLKNIITDLQQKLAEARN